jgi:hypothetical protein
MTGEYTVYDPMTDEYGNGTSTEDCIGAAGETLSPGPNGESCHSGYWDITPDGAAKWVSYDYPD